MHTPLYLRSFILLQSTFCTDSVSICEGADLCMGNSVTWGALVSSTACESHYPPFLSTPCSPSTSFYCNMLNLVLYFSFVIFKPHCLGEVVVSWHQTTLCLLYMNYESARRALFIVTETKKLGKTARRNPSYFFTVFSSLQVSSWILWGTCTVRVWGEAA